MEEVKKNDEQDSVDIFLGFISKTHIPNQQNLTEIHVKFEIICGFCMNRNRIGQNGILESWKAKSELTQFEVLCI